MPARPPEFVSKAASKGELSEVVKWLRKGGDVDAEDDFRGGTSSSGFGHYLGLIHSSRNSNRKIGVPATLSF